MFSDRSIVYTELHVTVEKCKILFTTHGTCAVAHWSDKRLAELSVLTKEKLVAPLFSVWIPDKRNRGCFGQTLFGHGQPTYMHAAVLAPLAQIYATVCTVHSVPLVFCFSLSLSLSLSLFSHCFRREPPFYCTLVSFWLQSLCTHFPFIFLAISFYSCFISIVQLILLFDLSHYFLLIRS